MSNQSPSFTAGPGLTFSGSVLLAQVGQSLGVNFSNEISLVGDQTLPGTNCHYGTDSSGVKGWFVNSGGSSLSSDQLTATGQLLGARIDAISGPVGFVYATGGPVALTADHTKSSQNISITAIGDVVLGINGTYDGCNGVVTICKTYAGTGCLTLPVGAYLINGKGSNIIALSTGVGGYDVASFVYDNARSYWAVSTLQSNPVSVASIEPTGTLVSANGAAVLSKANLVGLGGVVVVQTDDHTIVISGVAGSSSTPSASSVNLGGGGSLTLNTSYYDAIQGARSLSFVGTAIDNSFVTLKATVTGFADLAVPSSYRVGQLGSITHLALGPGNHEISWVYTNTKWWMIDSASSVSNFAANTNPVNTDDSHLGYAIGSQWINTGRRSFYQCVDSSVGAANWMPIQSAQTAAVHVTGNFSINSPVGYIWSGAGTTVRTGILVSPFALSGYQIKVKNISSTAALYISGNVDYQSTGYSLGKRQNVNLWSDGSTWVIAQ